MPAWPSWPGSGGIEVVELARGQRLRELVDEAVERGADALGMAGGDGSLGIVAAAAESHGLPFICIPVGTRNHFARDLGLDPDDPAGALKAFSDEDERWIDVGTVNGRLFLNCVSLGIYGEAVRQAEYRDRLAGASPPSGRAWSAASLEVSAPEAVNGGLDGEAVELAPPLKFAIRPGALRVKVPRLGRARS